jgi:hypothetical protein
MHGNRSMSTLTDLVKGCTPKEMESATLHLEDRLARLELFVSLDRVVQAFLDTSVFRGKHYTLTEVLALDSHTKQYFMYEHQSLPYKATIRTIEDYDAAWLCIKSVNDGLQYIAMSMSSDEFLQHFPNLLKASKEVTDVAKVLYTIDKKRIDIKLYPVEGWMPHLMVTFEESFPDWSYSVPKSIIPRETDRES